MRLADFDYELPPELIAQEPVEPRDLSRMMVYNRSTKEVEHRLFKDLLEYLNKGDTLVINDTKVMPARLWASKEGTGARIEVVLLRALDKNKWEVLVKPGKKARPGTKLIFGEGLLEAEVVDITEAGGRILNFHYQGVFEEILDRLGQMPLPPYITIALTDQERYQTVYAQTWGSAAAPTAGLHFTPELLRAIEAKGVNVATVLLHVGLGTFRPVKAENILEHQMHAEFYELSPQSAKLINQTKAAGQRVVAVGTTSVRTLETSGGPDGQVKAGSGWTDIFIYPGYQFKIVDALVTNFHLPKSTLLMLISAFAGRQEVLDLYQEAVTKQYRFFSFGDAMLLL